MLSRTGFSRYSLYGERGISLPAEFVHLERIHDRSSLHDWTIKPHAHPHMVQLLLLQAGGSQLASDGTTQEIGAPALIVVPPSCVHAFRFDPGAEGWVLSLATDLLNDPRMSGLLGGLPGLEGLTRSLSLQGAPAIEARLGWLLPDLAQRLGQGEAPGPGLLAQVALILATAAETVFAASPESQSDGREPLVARLRGLIEVHYRQSWSVADYAGALATTPSTLTRVTRALVRKAPADMVHDRLVLEAKRNLAFTGATVAQIAYALGFSDPAYFARFFKTRTGLTASAFREKRAWTNANLSDDSA